MKPYPQTREWKHPEGYKFLAPWTNAALLRFLIRKFTETLPRSEHRSKTQLDDAGRSVVSNIEDGYKRPTTKQYLDFIGFGQGSLEEIKGLVRQAHQDGFLKSKPGSNLADFGIDLREIKGLLKDSKGEVPLEILYPSLKSLKGTDLTMEIFLELINKTDWLIRQLVASLEKKVGQEMPMSAREQWLKWKDRERREREKKIDEELQEYAKRLAEERKLRGNKGE